MQRLSVNLPQPYNQETTFKYNTFQDVYSSALDIILFQWLIMLEHQKQTFFFWLIPLPPLIETVVHVGVFHATLFQFTKPAAAALDAPSAYRFIKFSRPTFRTIGVAGAGWHARRRRRGCLPAARVASAVENPPSDNCAIITGPRVAFLIIRGQI